ncbi:DUF916 and DUF3324 domain-containing protein [Enterococcus gilvus]|uniref:DUF916 and DUF3324 domain-containing protein n=1 Tax=Enterococcus gilvus TaxID=160453 RepID=UPI003ED9650A
MFKHSLMRLAGVVLCTFPLLTPTVTHAADVGYDVQAVIPENQVDKTKSFFDLRMQPDQKQTISVRINNTSDQDSEYKVTINQAYTSDQGFIDYSDPKKATENEYPYAIHSIAKVDDQVRVPKNSSKEVPITLSMPKKSYDGQILAAIQVVKTDKESETGISNNYGYILGLKLTESDAVTKRQLTLTNVKAAESFGKTSVVAALKNPTMDAYGHLKYEAEVKKASSGSVVRTVSYDNDMQIAPNSTYHFAIDWQNKKLEAGKYDLHLKVSDAKKNVWTFDRPFTISKEQAKDVNEATIEATDNDRLPSWVFIVIGILLAIILLGIIWLLLAKRKKKDDKETK